MTSTHETTHWQCPGCGHLITDDQRHLTQYDIQCGGCRKRKWSEFTSVHIISTNEDGGKIGE